MQMDPVRFFKENSGKLPSLSIVARLVLSIPASSAEVERSFSMHKLLLHSRRLRLLPVLIREIRYLQANWDICFPNN